MKNNSFVLPKNWHTSGKERISCKEKIKVLNENIKEFQNLANDILDEAILMGADKEQFLETMKQVVLSTDSNLKSAK